MEPAVRGAWAQSGIAESARLPPKFKTQHAVVEPISAWPGNGHSRCGDGRANAAQLPNSDPGGDPQGQRKPASSTINAPIPARAPTQRLGGGRTRARTWDPMIKSLTFILYFQWLNCK